ncbi:MAG: glutamine--fructose-6-phosphate transaminase (isomerizing), partial [Planctomycetota bacterium]
MCGIVGSISHKPVRGILLEGLRRLEYRGYDSAGLVTVQNGSFKWAKMPGKIAVLENHLKNKDWDGPIGLAHTRWATHGQPIQCNAHPHFSCDHKIVVVHNGIIENYEPLKEKLIKEGHKFQSETDTEIIVHLIEKFYKQHHQPLLAVREAIKHLQGSFALGIIFLDRPDCLIGARLNSPLVVGLGKQENFLASDVTALLPFTKKVIYLNENELVELRRDRISLYGFSGKIKHRAPSTITWDITSAQKEGYPHFMLKEIFEQPQAVRSTLSYYINRNKLDIEFPTLKPLQKKLSKIKRIIIVACGTAWHAGLVGKYALEELAGLPVEVTIASEFRYGNPVLDNQT